MRKGQTVHEIGQGHIFEGAEENPEAFKNLLETLLEIDTFYKGEGGVRQYHTLTLKLLKGENDPGVIALKPPKKIDITKYSNSVIRLSFGSILVILFLL